MESVFDMYCIAFSPPSLFKHLGKRVTPLPPSLLSPLFTPLTLWRSSLLLRVPTCPPPLDLMHPWLPSPLTPPLLTPRTCLGRVKRETLDRVIRIRRI